jgi:uncharacterized protein (TIGR00299 family) protein
MKTSLTYIDCGSGVAGDMLLGALMDLGLSTGELQRMLEKTIPVRGWKLRVQRVERQGWPARSFVVDGDRYFGSGEKMKQVVRSSRLPHPVKDNALQIFDQLLTAEKKAHGGKSIGQFDPDGLGLLDTLVDVVGNAWGFWRLGLTDISVSAINTGRIAPATAQIIKECKMPVYSAQSQFELATPTGVAILSVLANTFGAMPTLCIQGAGYGAGLRDMTGKPNALGIYRGTYSAANHPYALEQVLVLETVIDDMDPRLYSHVSDMLMKAGALDCWWISAGMKKGRPGIAYSVLCKPVNEDRLVEILFQETTTLGIRRLPLERWTLPRQGVGMRKMARLSSGKFKSQVEYELARQKAISLSIPLIKLLK